MKAGHRLAALAALTLGLPLVATTAQASSHREALAVLNEPCADNTDTYAWVKPGTHDKLYLIANFNPLHEPGQGNQGLRACNGYRYEFHVGKGTRISDQAVYRIEFNNTLPADADPSATDAPLGSNELLWQLTGGTETATVTRIRPTPLLTYGIEKPEVMGSGLAVAPNNHGPQTDRLVNGLAPFQGYESGDPTSREVGLYDDAFIRRNFVHTLSGGGRFFAGQRDDPYYLDEKGIFDAVNLCRDGLFGIAGARRSDCEDVFTGFNVFTVALEIPITDLFPNGIPHNGVLDPNSTDSLLRVWFSISRPKNAMVDDNAINGVKYTGEWTQVGRNALPLFNAGLVGTARQTKYLHSTPQKDVSNFGGDILYPVLVRDAEVLGIYAALGIDPNAAGLKGPRVDIINAINLGRPIPIQDGFTGDVITLDAAIDSQFPNGRCLAGCTVANAPTNKEGVDVSDALISLIVAGNPAAGAGDGVGQNDKTYLTEFPYAAAPHQGLLEGHGGTNE
jgi:hypothetical protein